MTLRGQLEEQDHLIRKLQKQRLSDYQDLDKRISASRNANRPPAGAIGLGGYSGTEQGSVSTAVEPPIAQTGTVTTVDSAAGADDTPGVSEDLGDPATAPVAVVSQTPPAQTQTQSVSGNEKAAYDAAQALVKAQQFKDAVQAFRTFTVSYPQGTYIANAHYWLGVLYTYEAQTENAIKEFNTVVQSYPTHRKAPDALFKLAKAHHLRGDETTAKILLNRVATDYADSGDRAVQLAEQYLETEFGG